MRDNLLALGREVLRHPLRPLLRGNNPNFITSGGGGGGGEIFVGALDDLTVAPTFAYSVRKLLSSYNGPLLRVRRGSDNAELDINPAGNGNLDVATITAFLSGSTGFVTSWYDQSGNNRTLAQQNPANQPLILLNSAFNNRPAIFFDQKSLWIASWGNRSQPLTKQYLWRTPELLEVNPNFQPHIFNSDNTGLAGANNQADYFAASEQLAQFAGNTANPFLVTANTSYVRTSVFNTTNSFVYNNGVEGGPASVGTRIAKGLTINAINGDNNQVPPSSSAKIIMPEFIEFDGVIPASDRTTLTANEAQYFGVTI